jgi:hypothetical protein
MRWLSNTYDPTRPDAFLYGPSRIADETQEEAYRSWHRWLKGKTIGKPKATDTYTTQELQKMHMVGVYDP